MYNPIKATLNGVSANAIVVNGVTYLAISSFIAAGEKVNTSNGVYSVNGHTGAHVLYQFREYLPWNTDPSIKATKDAQGGWVFSNENEPTPQPTTEKHVFATIQGRIINDAIYFTLEGENGVGNIQLDTGAFELTIAGSVAQAMNLPNMGQVQIEGVGGQNTAYFSQVSFKIGDRVFTNVPCVVSPSFTASDGLFGLRWFIDNKISLGVDTTTGLITFSA